MPAAEASPRVSLVTGAGRGLGAAIARRLAERGDRVVLHCHASLAQATALAADLDAAGAPSPLVLPADLRDPAAVTAMFDRLRAEVGRLDALVNNAGRIADGPITRMSEEDWAEVLDINLTGSWRCVKAAVRLLRHSDRAAIVQIGSSGAFRGTPGQANYAASKGGAVALVRSLARELGPRGIRVNAVVPGFMATDMTAHLDEERWQQVQAETPLGRLATPADVAAAVAWFTGDEARSVTGQVLVVDGGRV